MDYGAIAPLKKEKNNPYCLVMNKLDQLLIIIDTEIVVLDTARDASEEIARREPTTSLGNLMDGVSRGREEGIKALSILRRKLLALQKED